MPTYHYPSNYEISAVAPVKALTNMESRLIWKYMGTRTSRANTVRWNQRGNVSGLQQLRPLNTSSNNVQRVGSITYEVKPGVYEEFTRIEESELLNRAGETARGEPIIITDLIMADQDQLIQRRNDRMEHIGWNALLGTYSVVAQNGITKTDTFGVQTFTATVPWATHATATPLADVMAAQQLQRGQGVSFEAGSELVINLATFADLRLNTNQNDLGGINLNNSSATIGLSLINDVMARNNLPSFVVYDGDYIDSSNVNQQFIPANRGILIGKRQNQEKLLTWVSTPNPAHPDFASGPHMWVYDSGKNNAEGRPTPREIFCYDSNAGAIEFPYPTAVVKFVV